VAQTTADLLELAKAQAFWPASNGPLTDAQLLAIATSELRRSVFPIVVSAKMGYGLYYEDQPIAASNPGYRLPNRAFNGRLFDVQYVDTDGGCHSLRRMELDEFAEMGGGSDTADVGEGTFFAFAGNNVILYPTPASATGSLRLWYYLSPSKLVTVAECGEVDSFAGPAIISVADYPASIQAATAVDVVKLGGGGAHVALELAGALSVSDDDVWELETENASLDINPGDFVCLPGESCVISLPETGYSALCDLLVARMHQARRDTVGFQLASVAAKDSLALLRDGIADRIDGESTVYVPDDGIFGRGG
jgi:hypothetical protein